MMTCYTHDAIEAIGTCSVCGRAVCAECNHEVDNTVRCSAHVSEPVPQPPPLPPPAPPVPVSQPRLKSPGLAFVLGFAPSVGHLYLGLYRRALTIVGAFVMMILMSQLEEAFVLGCVWVGLFSAFDALRMSRAINAGGQRDSSAELLDEFRPGQGALIGGVALVVVGMLFWIQQLGVNLEFLRPHSPLLLVGFGGWLIWSTVQRKASAEPPPGLDLGR